MLRRLLWPTSKLVLSRTTFSTAWVRHLLHQHLLLLQAYAPAAAHCGTANLANTAPLPPEVLAALVSQLRAGSRSLLVTDAVSAEVQATVKRAY